MFVLDDTDMLNDIITVGAEVGYLHPLAFTQTVSD